ncbi:MAG: queuosine precursor transporter [Bacteroidota bacterium]|nr:queuosine precursor transporter [Bacteroidota bacterium]
MLHIYKDRPTKLFIAISAFFVSNALIAECIGSKIFSLEKLFGASPANLTLFGQKGLSFNLTCGVLLWPLEFIITDIVNEYYGVKAVRRISYTTIALIGYAFVMFFISIHLPSADFWIPSKKDNGIANMQTAYNAIFGQGLWIIVGSLTAFLISQLIDVAIFHSIKKRTGHRHIWLRATGSTLISQLIDSFVVLIIAFKFGSNWTWAQVIAVGILNYTYKSVMAIGLTPVIYFAERKLDAYLGKEVAEKMKREAMLKSENEMLTDVPAAG